MKTTNSLALLKLRGKLQINIVKIDLFKRERDKENIEKKRRTINWGSPLSIWEKQLSELE